MWCFQVSILWALLLIVSSLQSALVQAEMYVAGQVGVTLPQSLSNVEVSDPSIGLPSGSTSSNLDLQTSVMYGAKLGYYFESLKWLGIETEVFNATPHVKQQPVTVTVPGVGSTTFTPAGSYLRVLTWAPINLVVRYQVGKFEPYAGVGMGIFFSRLKDAGSNDSTSSTSIGLNTQLGVRYRVTNNVALFGEWKFNHARLSFDATPNVFTNIDGTYNAHHLVFGVGYHF